MIRSPVQQPVRMEKPAVALLDPKRARMRVKVVCVLLSKAVAAMTSPVARALQEKSLQSVASGVKIKTG
jgi:hypothetical protein